MPSVPSIRTSIENKDVLVLDEHAKLGNFQRDARNRLVAYTGGFSVVFPYRNFNGEEWAFRCWHSDIGDMRQRMQILSAELRKLRLPYLCDFEYVPEGLVIDGKIYPATRMKWIEGQNLKEYICSHRDKGALLKLADDFLKMCNDLHANHIAHGDLQHENILVDEKGKLYLVDYDSVYIPAMGEQNDVVVGKSDYQHPQRKFNKKASERLDYFSELVIYLSIKGIADNLSLIDKYQGQDTDYLLFKKEDYEDLTSSPILHDLLALGQDYGELLDIMCDYLSQQDINNLSPFTTALFEKHITFASSTSKAIKDKQKITITWDAPVGAAISLKYGEKKKNILQGLTNSGKHETKLHEDTTFELSVRLADGREVCRTIAVSVFNESVISFKADKLYVFPQVPIKLSWNVKHAKHVWLGDEEVNTRGSKKVKQDKETTYVLKVEDEFGIKEERICIKMLPVPQVKSLLVPTPKITNNLSLTIKQPTYNVDVRFPRIDIDWIHVEVPKVPSPTTLGINTELSSPLPIAKFNIMSSIKKVFNHIKLK